MSTKLTKFGVLTNINSKSIMKKHVLLIAATASILATANANEYTMVFDGDNSLGGLPRQTDEKNLNFVDGFSLTEEGINFTISKTDGSGNGYALVNAGGDKAGIYVSSKVDTKIELTVPNGTISAAKVYISGYALTALDLTFNGNVVESSITGTMYYWKWSDKDNVESLSIEWPAGYDARYIHSIELTYTEDLGGKQECGLSFSKNEVEATIGEKFSAPTLNNPNNLPVTWTSSNENVATVDQEGNLTLIGGGTTNIIVSTDGNDEYAHGNVKYELTVIPVAQNLVQMKEVAPKLFDKVKVKFPATVAFAYSSYAFVIDSEGNAGCFNDNSNSGSMSEVPTMYKVGDVIPEGWIATNNTTYESVIWEGKLGKATEKVDITYPEVESVTPEDVDKVVILKNVTFETTTAIGTTKAYGTTPDGTRYEFQDNYNSPYMPAGTYDVTCLVKYAVINSKVYFYLAPIAYTDPSGQGSGVKNINSNDTNAAYYDMTGKKIANPQGGVFVKVVNDKAEKVILK